MYLKTNFLNILFSNSSGWKYDELPKYSVKFWFKGNLFNKTINSAIIELCNIKDDNKFHYAISKFLLNLNGNFAFVICTRDHLLLITDKLRSYPLIYSSTQGKFNVGGSLIDLRSLSEKNIFDKHALTSLSMSGYTIGSSTIYKNIKQVNPGNYIKFSFAKKNTEIRTYFRYSPWMITERNNETLVKDLTDKTVSIFEKIFDNIRGRQIIVPLSAGSDSRLVASALKLVGAKDVICFAFGLKTNFEIKISQAVANKLGFKWHYSRYNINLLRDFFNSSTFKNYLNYADTGINVPFVGDLFAFENLISKGLIDRDAVVINGNAGDFISGGHIPSSLKSLFTSVENKEKILFDSIIKKHFSLWESLKTKENIKSLEFLLREEYGDIKDDLVKSKNYFSYFEYSEFMNRQSKYVSSAQRAYEYFDIDWRLPLWDDDYLIFWQSIPFDYKFNKKLYKQMLFRNNFSDVWKDIPINNYQIKPYWLRYLRNFTKALFLPTGKSSWHKFDKNVFAYYLDNYCNYAIVPYSKVLWDKGGHRNSISWHTKRYLDTKVSQCSENHLNL